MNLYIETLELLKEHKKTFDDVIAIYGNEFQITKEDFIKYSNTEYHEGYGAPEVALDLHIAGKDFLLSRYEYDGSEHWDFHLLPPINLPFKSIAALTVHQVCPACVGWKTLSELNK